MSASTAGEYLGDSRDRGGARAAMTANAAGKGEGVILATTPRMKSPSSMSTGGGESGGAVPLPVLTSEREPRCVGLASACAVPVRVAVAVLEVRLP